MKKGTKEVMKKGTKEGIHKVYQKRKGSKIISNTMENIVKKISRITDNKTLISEKSKRFKYIGSVI